MAEDETDDTSALAAFRAELEARGIRPAKRLGQNFMVDPNMAAAVARAAGVGPGDVVLEVGPGAGHLTRELMRLRARVVAVEIDRGLAALLLERLARDIASAPGMAGGMASPGIRLILGDAMEKGSVISAAVAAALREEIASAGGKSFRVAANLPYGIAATFLVALASSDLPWSGGAVTTQREVAERLASPAGSPAYGASSILWQLGARGRIERIIPPEVFWPRPEVDSALFVIEPLSERVWRASSGFARFVKALFSQRRKVLGTSVERAVPACSAEAVASALALAGLSPGSRVEEASPEALLTLWLAVERKTPTGSSQ
jgi:16S rRNA (adenine1518-N6/adenine1519-N6)-dimethyltransferase